VASPYYFDKALARAAVDFFPRFLRFTIGEWAGKPFVLDKWQAHHTGQIFGWRRRSDGTRRYRKVRGFIPKKNGKSEWEAGIGHLLTIADNEPGAEVFCYARDLAQASIVFKRATAMVTLDCDRFGNAGPLASLYEPSRTSLFCPSLMAAFKPMAGNIEGKHGPAAHGALGDEAHEWKDGTLHSFLVGGMANRRQPLDAIFTTAGKARTYAHELYEDAKAILADPSLDPECYVFVYEAEENDDWTSPEVWRKANPNFGISPKKEFLESQCRAAMRSARLENDFKRYHLGLWTEQTTRWFPMHRWRDNTAAPDDANYWRMLPAKMQGRRAFLGIDLASTEDIAAKIALFPPENSAERWTIIPRFYVPEATVGERDKPARPYRRWVEQEALTATPGNVTDYDFIEHDVIEDAARYQLTRDDPNEKTIAIDRWNATQVAVHLGNEGLPVALFGQGFASMAAPSKELERLYLDGQLEHGNHPVMKWMFGNAAFKKDPAGNIKPDRERSGEKIDGVVGTVMPLALAMAAGKNQETLTGSDCMFVI
jgi:phage terminase large subunit-like protein